MTLEEEYKAIVAEQERRKQSALEKEYQEVVAEQDRRKEAKRSGLESAARSVDAYSSQKQSAMLAGFDDELVAGVEAPFRAASNWWGGGEFNPGEQYSQRQKELQAVKDEYQRTNPTASLVGDVTGTIGQAVGMGGSGLTTGAIKNAPTAARIAMAGGEGAAYSGAHAAGNAEQGQRLAALGPAAVEGGAIAMGADALLRGAGRGVRGVRNLRRGKGTTQQASKEMADRINRAKKQKIDLSTGQASKDFADEAWETDALRGGRGNVAQRTMGDQRVAQEGQIANRMREIQDIMAPGTKVTEPAEAATNIQRAVKNRYSDLKNRAGALYTEIGESGAQVPNIPLSRAKRRVLGALEANDGLVRGAIDPDNTGAAQAMRVIDDFMDNTVARSDGMVDVNDIVRLQKKLTPIKPAMGNNNDGRLIGVMKREVDKLLGESVKGTGQKALWSKYSKAKDLTRKYKGIANNERKIVRDMLSDDKLTPRGISDVIIGSNAPGSRVDGSAVVKELKKQIGSTVEGEMALRDVKRAVVDKVMVDAAGEIKSPKMLVKSIDDFTRGKGQDLARELFGDEGLRSLREIREVLKDLSPSELTQNPSGTGNTVARLVKEFMGKALTFGGLASGSPGAVVGGIGMDVLGDRIAGRKAAQMAAGGLLKPAMRPKITGPSQSLPPSLIAGGANMLTHPMDEPNAKFRGFQ